MTAHINAASSKLGENDLSDSGPETKGERRPSDAIFIEEAFNLPFLNTEKQTDFVEEDAPEGAFFKGVIFALPISFILWAMIIGSVFALISSWG